GPSAPGRRPRGSVGRGRAGSRARSGTASVRGAAPKAIGSTWATWSLRLGLHEALDGVGARVQKHAIAAQNSIHFVQIVFHQADTFVPAPDLGSADIPEPVFAHVPEDQRALAGGDARAHMVVWDHRPLVQVHPARPVLLEDMAPLAVLELLQVLQD